MQFDIITIFPDIIKPYLKEGLIGKACKKNYLKVKVHDLRNFSSNKHRQTDDTPFGGGGGMVMKAEPIIKAVERVRIKEKVRVILFTPRGRRFNQKKATEFAKYEQIVMICGRYEGVDERILKYVADEGISIGSYVLMGGELPAVIVVETVSRLVKGVVGKENFLKERQQKEAFLEYPQYTKPEKIIIKGKERTVPAVLLSGDHKKIKEWKDKKGKLIK